MKVEVKTIAVTTLVGIAHFICGIAVLFAPSALNVTPLNGIWDVISPLHFPPAIGGGILVGVGTAAIIACTATFPLRAFLLIPQQLLLALQIWSISFVFVSGVYPDGYIPVGGHWFIIADQIWPWLLAVSHSTWLAVYIYQGMTYRSVKALIVKELIQ